MNQAQKMLAIHLAISQSQHVLNISRKTPEIQSPSGWWRVVHHFSEGFRLKPPTSHHFSNFCDRKETMAISMALIFQFFHGAFSGNFRGLGRGIPWLWHLSWKLRWGRGPGGLPYPIGSMVLVYMLTFGYMNGKCYHIWQHHGSYGLWFSYFYHFWIRMVFWGFRSGRSMDGRMNG